MDDGGEHAVTRRTVLRQQLFGASDDRTKIRLVGDYAMLDNLCKSRTHLVKWKRSKDLRVHNYCGRGVENADQILAGGGIDSCFAADGCIHHRHQTGGYLNDGNPTHESGCYKP